MASRKKKRRVSLSLLAGRTVELVARDGDDGAWEVHIDGQPARVDVRDARSTITNSGTCTTPAVTTFDAGSAPLNGFVRRVRRAAPWERRGSVWVLSTSCTEHLGDAYNTSVYETLTVSLEVSVDLSVVTVIFDRVADVST